MAPLVEAILVFVGVPAMALGMLAMAIYGATVAIRSIAERMQPAVAIPSKVQVIAFPGARRTEPARDVRRAA